MKLQPLDWKDKPSLIEHIFPVHKISAESFKEQMAGSGKTLTALGNYWKGRKPLILNKACILGTLLPKMNTSDHPDDLKKDLEIFELLMGMDSQSMQIRIKASIPKSKHDQINKYLSLPYHEQVQEAKRTEELIESDLFAHVWEKVNDHLGTDAHSFQDLIEQIGIARFGRRPKVADVFSGSGQIPFEAARLGCDVYASDLNPIACMLTWGAFNLVGASKEQRDEIDRSKKELVQKVQDEIDELGVESDGNGWQGKVYLYCVEVTCPESGWKVPILTTCVISQNYKVIAQLKAIPSEKRYHIDIQYVESNEQLETSKQGTLQDGYLIHSPDGITIYRVNIKTIRGDYKEGSENKNKLRIWGKNDFIPKHDDIFQERLYCIQWVKKKPNKAQFEYQFRSVSTDDLIRENKVIDLVRSKLNDWQNDGLIPDMLIEKGDETERLYRERGWSYWHQLFNPRQLLRHAIVNKYANTPLKVSLQQILNANSRLCRWSNTRESIQQTFDSQALNTIYNYGCRGYEYYNQLLMQDYARFPLKSDLNLVVHSHPAQELNVINDIYITDPPYGDAVKYEEITEFFIAWLRKKPPQEFANWTWDSRRVLAIKGEDDGFRRGMINSYRKITEKMTDHGIQVLMFTHQSGSLWADMANIVWASGLQVTAAWYVVTETDSSLRDGAYVTGTIMLVLRKRQGKIETFRDELAWEIEEAVQKQLESLINLDQSVRDNGAESLYNDADLQMAGYAAALKVLTKYVSIDGKNMIMEAEAPRQKGKITFVDELIDFAVRTAVQFLVPNGFKKEDWQKIEPVERFYLKMVDMESKGEKSLDNYQNFARAFKIRDDFNDLISEKSKANSTRLKLSNEFKQSYMSSGHDFAKTKLRALLYAMYEQNQSVDIDLILSHLMQNTTNYHQNQHLLIIMAEFIAQKREVLTETKTFLPKAEASSARIIAEAIKNQRI